MKILPVECRSKKTSRNYTNVLDCKDADERHLRFTFEFRIVCDVALDEVAGTFAILGFQFQGSIQTVLLVDIQ